MIYDNQENESSTNKLASDQYRNSLQRTLDRIFK